MMLPRKFALPLSLALTALVGFVLTSFASDAGWLSAASSPMETAFVEEPTAVPPTSSGESILGAPLPPAGTAGAAQPEVVEIIDYVYQDVPVYREVAVAAVPSTTTPPNTAALAVTKTNDSVSGEAPTPEPPLSFESPSIGQPSAASTGVGQPASATPKQAAAATSAGSSEGPQTFAPPAATSSSGPASSPSAEDAEEYEDGDGDRYEAEEEDEHEDEEHEEEHEDEGEEQELEDESD